VFFVFLKVFWYNCKIVLTLTIFYVKFLKLTQCCYNHVDFGIEEANDDNSTVVDTSVNEDTSTNRSNRSVPSTSVRTTSSVVDFAGVVINNNEEDNGMSDAPFTMDEIKDGVVSEKTTAGYIGSILTFLTFCAESTIAPYSLVLTESGHERLGMLQQRVGERWLDYGRRKKVLMRNILREASEIPIIDINVLSGDDMMNYFRQLKNKKTGRTLASKSSFGNHRAALNHLYRCHNRRGYGHDTCDHLKTLFKGLNRNIAQRSITAVRFRRVAGSVVGIQDDGTATVVNTIATGTVTDTSGHEAKQALSVEVLKLLLQGFLDWNTTGGVFSYTYLLLTWCLMCRSENTALIKLGDIVWSTSFDSFQIFFSHTKTDQTGDESNQPRHLYANPHNPLMCPVTALGIYFTTCFNTELISDAFYLFPGKTFQIVFTIINFHPLILISYPKTRWKPGK
jgi:hypothetical protein